jgi:hypothetical protein
MNFEELIDTLSKGSATAVTTLESNVAELNALKEYLYVQTPSNRHFEPRSTGISRLPALSSSVDPVVMGNPSCFAGFTLTTRKKLASIWMRHIACLKFLLLSPELVYQFKLFEHIVAHRRKQKLDIRMPFHHLKSSGVWIPVDKHGEPSTHRSVTTCVRLDPEFRAACLDAEFRQRAATILIETYFRPEEQIALREMMGLPPDVVIPESESDETPEQEARSEGRSARFRLDVSPPTTTPAH